MRVGILDVLAPPATNPADLAYAFVLTKQYASITPQAVAVWSRELGHQTFYRTYYGVGDPARTLPPDLDVLFVACYTQTSPLAYALARAYGRRGTLTVIGGPHARSFPADCLRFFDLVVRECDRELVADILRRRFDPGSVVSSARPFEDVPTVEERMPEIRTAALYRGRWRYFLSAVPMLASTGCPYACDFCVDWNNPYRLLSLERLAADLRYLARRLPGILLGFHDPNFAVKFDQVLEVLEEVPPRARLPYIMESSLTILRGARMERLQASRCIAVAPGIESWGDYSNKAAVGRATGAEKVERVAEHLGQLHEHVPYIQVNLIFGLDSDAGDEPVSLTREFFDRTPFAWPALNIPVPYGGTPLQQRLLAEGRVLRAMPFGFYYAPYLVLTLKHYDPTEYYARLIALCEHATSARMLRCRLASARLSTVRVLHATRTASLRAQTRVYRRILERLRSDAELRRFHEGRSAALPEFYHRAYERMLGRYAELVPRRERAPEHDAEPVTVGV